MTKIKIPNYVCAWISLISKIDIYCKYRFFLNPVNNYNQLFWKIGNDYRCLKVILAASLTYVISRRKIISPIRVLNSIALLCGFEMSNLFHWNKGKHSNLHDDHASGTTLLVVNKPNGRLRLLHRRYIIIKSSFIYYY